MPPTGIPGGAHPEIRRSPAGRWPGGAINIVTNDYWACLSGVRQCELSSSGPGAIQQTDSPRSSGSVYRLTFSISRASRSRRRRSSNLRVQAGANRRMTYTVRCQPRVALGHALGAAHVDFTAPGPAHHRHAHQPGCRAPRVRRSTPPASTSVSADVGAGPARLALAPIAPDPLRGEGAVGVLRRQWRSRCGSRWWICRAARSHGFRARTLRAGPTSSSLAALHSDCAPGLYFLILDAGDRSDRAPVHHDPVKRCGFAASVAPGDRWLSLLCASPPFPAAALANCGAEGCPFVRRGLNTEYGRLSFDLQLPGRHPGQAVERHVWGRRSTTVIADAEAHGEVELYTHTRSWVGEVRGAINDRLRWCHAPVHRAPAPALAAHTRRSTTPSS